jgi:hypothetical protein
MSDFSFRYQSKTHYDQSKTRAKLRLHNQSKVTKKRRHLLLHHYILFKTSISPAKKRTQIPCKSYFYPWACHPEGLHHPSLLYLLHLHSSNVCDRSADGAFDAEVNAHGDTGQGHEDAGHLVVAWEGAPVVDAEALRHALAKSRRADTQEVQLLNRAQQGLLVLLRAAAPGLAAGALCL